MSPAPNINQVPTPETTPTGAPQVVPHPGIGVGHPEYHFVQGLMEVQKTLVEITTDMKHLTKSVDSLKTKVDDLIRVKNLVLGGGVAIGAVVGLIIVIAKYGSEYVMLKPSAPPISSQAAPAPLNPPASTLQEKSVEKKN